MRIVVSQEYPGLYYAMDENYGGPPEHVGTGRTQHEAIVDLLAWFDDEYDLGAITVLVEP